MFKNEFVVSGICKRVSEIKNDAKEVQGLYVTIATIGDSYSMYVQKDCPGRDHCKLEEFLEIHGHLKTKYVVNKDEKANSIAALGVDQVLVGDNPLN
jgi:hypothetical protein